MNKWMVLTAGITNMVSAATINCQDANVLAAQ